MFGNIRCFAIKLTTIRNISAYIPKARLDGKVAIVTASTAGIGFGIARRLAREGAKVVLCSRKDKNVQETVQKLTAEGLKVTGTVCHVAKQKDRENLYAVALKEYGGIDILVSNAGTNLQMGPLFECNEKIWDKTFEINVKAAFLLAKEVLPHLKKRGGGSIVFVSSIGGLQPLQDLGAYSVTKTAVIGLTKAAARDLAGDNINVNSVAPGIIKTKFSSALHENETAAKLNLSQIPMRRFGEVDDIAGVVSFLVSNDAKYVTGETIVCAGGMQSRL